MDSGFAGCQCPSHAVIELGVMFSSKVTNKSLFNYGRVYIVHELWVCAMLGLHGANMEFYIIGVLKSLLTHKPLDTL